MRIEFPVETTSNFQSDLHNSFHIIQDVFSFRSRSVVGVEDVKDVPVVNPKTLPQKNTISFKIKTHVPDDC